MPTLPISHGGSQIYALNTKSDLVTEPTEFAFQADQQIKDVVSTKITETWFDSF